MSKEKQVIRHNFRVQTFHRDKYKCVLCGETSNLECHHILNRNAMPNGGYVKENGITLCPPCHRRAEDGIPTQEELFELIGSNASLASRLSARLKG